MRSALGFLGGFSGAELGLSGGPGLGVGGTEIAAAMRGKMYI